MEQFLIRRIVAGGLLGIRLGPWLIYGYCWTGVCSIVSMEETCQSSESLLGMEVVPPPAVEAHQEIGSLGSYAKVASDQRHFPKTPQQERHLDVEASLPPDIETRPVFDRAPEVNTREGSALLLRLPAHGPHYCPAQRPVDNQGRCAEELLRQCD
ncbi:hypothetical protein NL676_003742 [Syzygium grande]|nr:hypothetical protein NL676_003742 [Syzygium grande]